METNEQNPQTHRKKNQQNPNPQRRKPKITALQTTHEFYP